MRFSTAVRKMAGVPGRYVGPVRLATALAEWKGPPPSSIRLVTIRWAFSEFGLNWAAPIQAMRARSSLLSSSYCYDRNR